MKLQLIAQDEHVERVTLTLHTNVLDQLKDYKLYYEASLQGKIQQGYLIEEMLKCVMREDKDFHKFLKSHPSRKSTPPESRVVEREATPPAGPSEPPAEDDFLTDRP